jgi:hypothetical protein
VQEVANLFRQPSALRRLLQEAEPVRTLPYAAGSEPLSRAQPVAFALPVRKPRSLVTRSGPLSLLSVRLRRLRDSVVFLSLRSRLPLPVRDRVRRLLRMRHHLSPRVLLVLVLLCTGGLTPVAARDLSTQERLADFDQLLGFMRASYGMREYKETLLSFQLEPTAKSFRDQIPSLSNDDQFYDLVSRFLAMFKDSHLAQFRPSSMSAKLGFEVRRVEGKAIITTVDRKLLPKETFPFTRGDELVSLAGRPIENLLKEQRLLVSSSREASALGGLTRRLTQRTGVRGPVPTGSCALAIRSRATGQVGSVTLPWQVHGRPLPGVSFFESSDLYPLPPGDTQTDMSWNCDAATLSSPSSAPWLPEDAQMVDSEVFSCCTFPSPAGTMGYIRIRTFKPENDQDARKEFGRLISSLAGTKGLVVDITDNPGGHIQYCYHLLAMLTDKTLSLPAFAMRPTRVALNNYRQWAEGAKTPERKKAYQMQADELERCLGSGAGMTGFGPGFGRSVIEPDAKVRYTRPIVVLVNDQCYSCGDLFPAILQDNRRATIFGTNTAGAGGSVSSYGPLSYSGSSIHLTETLQRRSSGAFLENVGVKPDVPWELTQADVAAGFEAYRDAYVATLQKLVR